MRNEKKSTQGGELLARGKVARADMFACGHLDITFESFRIGFSLADFKDFAATVAMARANLDQREAERNNWGLYF